MVKQQWKMARWHPRSSPGELPTTSQTLEDTVAEAQQQNEELHQPLGSSDGHADVRVATGSMGNVWRTYMEYIYIYMEYLHGIYVE